MKKKKKTEIETLKGKELFKKYVKLFLSCVYLSSFTFGGGYVIIPLMERKFVHDLKWLNEEEVIDITSIAQSSPGSIAVNTAILLGYKVLGFTGALVALLGTVLPSLIIVALVTVLYDFIAENEIVRAVLRGMQAGVAALVCNIALNLTLGVTKEKNKLDIAIMLAAFVLIFFVDVNVAYVILGCVSIGIIRAVVQNIKLKKKAKKDAENNSAAPALPAPDINEANVTQTAADAQQCADKTETTNETEKSAQTAKETDLTPDAAPESAKSTDAATQTAADAQQCADKTETPNKAEKAAQTAKEADLTPDAAPESAKSTDAATQTPKDGEGGEL